MRCTFGTSGVIDPRHTIPVSRHPFGSIRHINLSHPESSCQGLTHPFWKSLLNQPPSSRSAPLFWAPKRRVSSSFNTSMVVPDTSLVAFQTQLFPLRARPSVKPFPSFAISPTLTPPSFRLPRIAIMNHCETTENSINQDTTHKAALSFILSSSDSETDIDKVKASKRELSSEATAAKRRRSVASTSVSRTAAAVGLTSKPGFKKGSKFCSIEGCTSRAKHAKRCWKHGGWVRCKVPDCNNRAKSKGVCWSHGGGTVCVFVSCDTIAVSNGVCWAHGGGKRCQVPNCSKPAYERTQNYCQTHYERFSALATS